MISSMSRPRTAGRRRVFALVGALAVSVSSFLAVSGEASGGELGNSGIAGEVADSSYPFMVSLQGYQGQHLCGGVLIAPQWVLTAASCDANVFFLAKIGSDRSDEGGEMRGVVNTYQYPDWSPLDDPGGDDLLLVKLDKPSSMAPVSLATAKEVASAQWLRTLGYEPAGAATPTRLRTFDADVSQDGASCRTIDGNFDRGRSLCMDGPDGETVDNGDGGGPQLVKGNDGWRLAGIISGRFEPWRTPVESPLWAGVNVSYPSHSDWISENTVGA